MAIEGFGQRELGSLGLWCIDTPITDYLREESVVNLRGWISINKDAGEIKGPFLSRSDRSTALHRVERRDVEAEIPESTVVGFDDVVELGFLAEGNYELTLLIDGNLQSLALPVIPDGAEKGGRFTERKASKLERIRPLLVCPVCRGELSDKGDQLVCATHGLVGARGRLDYQLVHPEAEAFPLDPPFSSLPYDPETRALLSGLEGGLVLDDGSGLRYEYFDEVVGLDLSPYPTTDVVATAEHLPFRDAAFDGLISVAVLEHVPDPRRCVAEIARVVRPEGWIYVAVPGLQPYHGYPKHYFNMTRDGLAVLFEEHFEIEEISTSRFGLPVHALGWFLARYLEGLPDDVRVEFKKRTIGELAGAVDEHLDKEFVTTLDQSAIDDLACVSVLRATRSAREVDSI